MSNTGTMTKSWIEALNNASILRRRKKYLIAQQINNDWYYMTMYRHNSSHTVNFDPKMDELIGEYGLNAIRKWSNNQSIAFNFQDEHVARESIFRLFGEHEYKKYKVIMGGEDGPNGTV